MLGIGFHIGGVHGYQLNGRLHLFQTIPPTLAACSRMFSAEQIGG